MLFTTAPYPSVPFPLRGKGKSLCPNLFLPPLGEGCPKDRKGAKKVCRLLTELYDFCKSLGCYGKRCVSFNKHTFLIFFELLSGALRNAFFNTRKPWTELPLAAVGAWTSYCPRERFIGVRTCARLHLRPSTAMVSSRSRNAPFEEPSPRMRSVTATRATRWVTSTPSPFPSRHDQKLWTA